MILISISKKDNVFNMTVNLPYGPPMNKDNGYYRTIFADLFVIDLM